MGSGGTRGEGERERTKAIAAAVPGNGGSDDNDNYDDAITTAIKTERKPLRCQHAMLTQLQTRAKTVSHEGGVHCPHAKN